MQNKTFTPFPILTTERLTLRQPSITDEQEVFTLRSDSEINKYLDRPPVNTIDDARNFISKVIENNFLYWAISFTDTNTLVGTICLFSFSDENNSCEIGYELLPNFQKQGIMQEAAAKVISYAFTTLGVKKIEASFHRDNQASAKLLEKLSFIHSNEIGGTNPELIHYYLIKPIE
jgi:[ribosomal protein S5]-alanine N-acetyltransferase